MPPKGSGSKSSGSKSSGSKTSGVKTQAQAANLAKAMASLSLRKGGSVGGKMMSSLAKK